MCVHRSRSSAAPARGLVASVLLVASALPAATAATAASAEGLVIVHHSRGPRWDIEAGFRDQPGIRDHVRYYETLDADGRILMGGPFLDDSGGMMILRARDSLDTIRGIAMSDPAVEAGVLGMRVLSISHPVRAADPVRVEQSKPDIRVVAWLSPGEGWSPDTPRLEQADMDAHVAFCRQQIEAGHFALVAPDGDDREIIVFMPGYTPDPASELLATDPAIASGVVTAATTEWLIVFKLERPDGSAE